MATVPSLFNGSDLYFSIGTGSTAVPIAMSKSCSITMTSTMLDTTTKDSVGGWAESIPVGRSWNGETSGLVVWGTNLTQLTNAINNRTLLDLKLERRDAIAGDIVFTGAAWISDFNLDAAQDEAVSYTVSFTGCGELVQTVKQA